MKQQDRNRHQQRMNQVYQMLAMLPCDPRESLRILQMVTEHLQKQVRLQYDHDPSEFLPDNIELKLEPIHRLKLIKPHAR